MWLASLGGGVLYNFKHGQSMPISGVRHLTLNHYLGSINSNIGKYSIFRVHKPEKGKKWCNLVWFIAVAQSINAVQHRGPRNIYCHFKSISIGVGDRGAGRGCSPPNWKNLQNQP